MTVMHYTAAEKREVVALVLDLIEMTHEQRMILKAVCADYRAETPEEAGRVLAAMTDQVQRARASRQRLGFYDTGIERTICEALCGRWWPVVERALKRHETEATT